MPAICSRPRNADSMSLTVAPMSGEEVAGRRAARRIAGSGGAGQGNRGGVTDPGA
jgi:hypothetical protein